MTTPRPPAKLSKSILDMKFMKRTKDKVLKEEDDAKGRAMYSNEITEKMLQGENLYIMESSYVPCEELGDGRYSFRGMNPEIERLIELENAAKDAASEKNVTKDISDADMNAHYYTNVKKTMEKKFQTKNHKRKMSQPEPANNNKFNKYSKFKKPKTDD